VVDISEKQMDFNKDLDGYLGGRVKQETIKADSDFEKEDKGFEEPFYKVLGAEKSVLHEEKVREIEEVEEEVEKEIEAEDRPGLLSRIKGFILGSDKDADEEDFIEEKKDTIPDDLKEVLKLQHKWINKLPPEKISEFKESEDFQKYTDVLRKYGLIK